MTTLRPAFRWTLGVSALASVAALWNGEASAPAVVAAVAPAHGTSTPVPDRTPQAGDKASAPLPQVLDRPALEPAARDLFQVVKVTPPPAPPPPAPAAVQVAAAPPPPPPPPPQAWRYQGSLRSPDGSAQAFIGNGEQVAIAKPGTELPNGYRIVEVKRADPQDPLVVTEIHLVYPPLNHEEVVYVSAPVTP